MAEFERLGAQLWADQTRAELARIGGRVPSRDELTEAERRIAALVAEGKTNREVAAALFLTERSVETALTRIYRKLGVRSRSELAHLHAARPEVSHFRRGARYVSLCSRRVTSEQGEHAKAGRVAITGGAARARDRRLRSRGRSIRAGRGASSDGRVPQRRRREGGGYELGYVNGAGNRIITGCIAHPTAGAMGYHYFNKELIDDLVVDVSKPEGWCMRRLPTGLKLVAVEYVVPGAGSSPPGVSEPPSVLGQEMVILVPAVGWYAAFLGLEHEPGRDLRPLEPRSHLYVARLSCRGAEGGPRLTLRGQKRHADVLGRGLPPPSRANLEDRADRLACRRRAGTRGDQVEHRRTTFLADDDASFYLFEAPSPAAIQGSVAARVSDASASSMPSKHDGVRRCALPVAKLLACYRARLDIRRYAFGHGVGFLCPNPAESP